MCVCVCVCIYIYIYIYTHIIIIIYYVYKKYFYSALTLTVTLDKFNASTHCKKNFKHPEKSIMVSKKILNSTTQIIVKIVHHKMLFEGSRGTEDWSNGC